MIHEKSAKRKRLKRIICGCKRSAHFEEESITEICGTMGVFGI